MSNSRAITVSKDPYNFLAKKNKTFFMQIKGSSLLYDVPGHPLKYRMITHKIQKGGLGFIQEVKRHVSRTNKVFEVDRSKIRYSIINERLKPGMSKGEWIEVDVNSAYWYEALKLGIINKDVFTKGQEVTKEVRLIALGALATLTEKWKVENYGEREIKVLHERPETYTSFFHICNSFSNQIMQPAFRKFASECVLFWVDAFIINKSASNDLISMLNGMGVKVKTKPITKIEITDKRINLHVPYQPKPKSFPRVGVKGIIAKDYKRRSVYREFIRTNE